MIRRALVAILSAAIFTSASAALLAQQVTFDRIQHPDKEPQNWLSYSENSLQPALQPAHADHAGQRRRTSSCSGCGRPSRSRNSRRRRSSSTACSTRCRVRRCRASMKSSRSTPATGRPFWTLEYKPLLEARPCCGRVSRGLAILGDTLYMGTIDAHLVAIDAKTGKILWDHVVEKVGDKATEKYAITHAPVVVKDKIIVGIAGGDLGVRGFICAFDAKTGKEALALLHDSRQRRARQRDVVGRLVENRRRRRVEQRRVRRGDEPRLLRHRQSRARLGRPRAPRRQLVQRQRRRARRGHRAS